MNERELVLSARGRVARRFRDVRLDGLCEGNDRPACTDGEID